MADLYVEAAQKITITSKQFCTTSNILFPSSLKFVSSNPVCLQVAPRCRIDDKPRCLKIQNQTRISFVIHYTSCSRQHVSNLDDEILLKGPLSCI